jgi:2-polyprenyl-6-methoxyphenol hydroxylase-like FAD-dependent oxidoreductase
VTVLIVGAGVAGPTLAYWLRRAGHDVTLVERAAAPRHGGYVIDFWGAGFDVADRMGVLPEILRRGYRIGEVRQVNDAGRTVAAFRADVFFRATGGRYVSIPRGDLASILSDALDDRVERIFGDTVRALDDDGARVRVTFEHGATRDFDLVVGADGQHSAIRRLVFGPEAQFETFLGITVAAFDVEGYRPRDELVYVLHTEVGRQIARFAMDGDQTMFLVTFRDDGRTATEDDEAQRSVLRARMAGAGWETSRILAHLSQTRTFYFDRVSQIRMPSWTRGRVALVGDAAACVSLLAGQGTALAMVEAYVLAAELSRAHGDHREAFSRYERMLMPFLRSKQEAAVRLAPVFAPKSRAQLFFVKSITKLMGLPLVANLAMGKSVRDAIELPPPPGA